MGIWIGFSAGHKRVKLSDKCHAFAEALPKQEACSCSMSACFAMPHTFVDIITVYEY